MAQREKRPRVLQSLAVAADSGFRLRNSLLTATEPQHIHMHIVFPADSVQAKPDFATSLPFPALYAAVPPPPIHPSPPLPPPPTNGGGTVRRPHAQRKRETPTLETEREGGNNAAAVCARNGTPRAAVAGKCVRRQARQGRASAGSRRHIIRGSSLPGGGASWPAGGMGSCPPLPLLPWIERCSVHAPPWIERCSAHLLLCSSLPPNAS